LARQPLHRRSVHPGPLVLGTAPIKLPTPTADRDRTVSRRSEPSSRAALMGEQPNPWDLLQPQDATSRHRTCVPYSYGRRLYLHPSTLLRGGEGPASESRHRVIPWLGNRRAISRFGVAEPISRYGVKPSVEGELTSHGIVLISSVHEMVGFHRYKLVLCCNFVQHTPHVEVPNLPVAVDARGRSACYPRGSFYPLSPDPSTRGPRIT
jgi:hypothetical protein